MRIPEDHETIDLFEIVDRMTELRKIIGKAWREMEALEACVTKRVGTVPFEYKSVAERLAK